MNSPPIPYFRLLKVEVTPAAVAPEKKLRVGGKLVGRAMFYRVRQIRGKYYLYKEWYDSESGRKKSVSLGNCVRIEQLVRGVGFEPTQAYAIGASARSPHGLHP